jgi:hypothetical protein
MFGSQPLSRREMLRTASCGFGYLALASLMAERAAAESQNPLAPKAPHFEPKAKRVIFMFMQGGPSHVDTFDYKPQLAADEGKGAGQQGNNNANRTWLPSPWEFKQHGDSGLPISDLFPHLAKHADDLCLLNGMYTDLPNHPQASVKMHTGNFQFVRPSLGAWVQYGLGTENQDLPGFITVNPPARVGGAQNYGSAFLPAAYQGTRIGGEGESSRTIPNISNQRMPPEMQRRQLDLVQGINRERLERDSVNVPLEGIIESYELAFRMQSAVPKLMDTSDESAATLAAYGVGEKATDDFGRQCLLARRLVESGVRFVEICRTGWDHHNGLKARLGQSCEAIDKPMAALVEDLQQRGLLKDTLLVWGGEFGRTPGVKTPDGRDHNGTGFSMWMAGGGVKGGIRYGATDEHGVTAVESKMHIHDLHATILHLLGLDHEKLTFRYSGRDFRLTDVYGNVAHEIIG